MKALVLGASGMAGHIITQFLKEQGYSVKSLSSKKKFDNETVLLDVTNTQILGDFLKKYNFNFVVNCIGVLTKESEENKKLAVLINSYLPHFLEDFYRNKSTRIIHISTDGVFGSENAPYREDSSYDGETFYGRSKALGEIVNDKDLTFRTSIIGPDMRKSGTGLFNWFLSQKGKVSGYTDVFWSGVTTLELSKAIKEAIEQNLTGVYHLVPQKNISKYDLLKLIKDEFSLDNVEIEADYSKKLNKTLINTREDFSFKVSDYKTMIKELKDWINSHQYIYSHYFGKDNAK